MNDGTFEERLAFGKAKEAEVMERLKRHFWSVIPATEAQDKVDKIDCWVRWKGVSYSCAIKWRESGYDLGIALVRPWIDQRTYFDQFLEGNLPYDRDFQHVADLYVLADDTCLMVVTGASVMARCDHILIEVSHGRWKGDGWEAKLVTDKGGGYTAGQKKLIAYISPRILEEVELP